MQRSDKELRKAAEHLVGYLPDDEAEARRIFEHALALKRWEDGGPLENGGAKLSLLGRK